MQFKYKTLKSGKSVLDVSGMSVNDILKISGEQMNRLNKSDLNRLTSRLVSAGNKRIRRIQKSGAESPAVRGAMESGGMFSVKGKNVNELRSEFSRIKSFYKGKTSSVKGAREYEGRFKEITSQLKSKEEVGEFFDALHKLKQRDVSTFTDKCLQITEEVERLSSEGKSSEEILEVMEGQMNEWYKLNQTEFESISGLFEGNK